ncbi:hypothetical protein EKO27_g2301 [Xylaria grammica]|uniref:Uncharacterized protein n=1 Tax=Xylaria grammica TaxID=363999 RepID=A0A439DEF7_9PEZI|nr:hypothetical protein EKO27_g2301 [Xylaria grammica]
MSALASGFSTQSDEANVRDHLLQHRHRKWGFVIYRCTYEADADWARFMAIVSARARDGLESSDAPDILRMHHWRVFDDRKQFDGASKDHVRRHFRSWCASDEAMAEQYRIDSQPVRPDGLDTMLGMTPRYTYCIHVDAESLRSVIHDGPQPPDHDLHGVGWVALIDSHWQMPNPETFDFEGNGLDPETDDPTDEGEVPVEGCRLYEVGWMRMGTQSIGVPAYAFLQRPGLFYAAYQRPPDVWVR